MCPNPYRPPNVSVEDVYGKPWVDITRLIPDYYMVMGFRPVRATEYYVAVGGQIAFRQPGAPKEETPRIILQLTPRRPLVFDFMASRVQPDVIEAGEWYLDIGDKESEPTWSCASFCRTSHIVKLDCVKDSA